MKVKHYSDPFQCSNNYYDLLYHDKDYLTEARYISSIIKKFLPAAKTLAELGSGTGNYSKAFCNLGYEVTGVERSSEMMQVANDKNIPGFKTILADMSDFNVDQQFDATVALFHVLSYLTTNKQVLSCFKQVAKHLKRGGLFIFDVWFTPAVYTQVPETRVKHVENELVHLTRIAKPTVNFQHNTVELQYDLILQHKADQRYEALNEVHLMRHFSTGEIELLASLSGFSLLRAEEFLTAKQPGSDTWGVCYILRKDE